MTERDLLLDTILNNPDDDTARLVYADWLSEFGGVRGAARAEFIRVQCELVNTPRLLYLRGTPLTTKADTGRLVPYLPITSDRAPIGIADKDGPVNPQHVELAQREQALLKKWGASWLPKCLRGEHAHFHVHGDIVFLDVPNGYIRFGRGFPETVGVGLAVILERNGPNGITVSKMQRAERFAQSVEAIFRHNPLTGFTVNFEDSPITLSAHLGKLVSESPTPVPYWRLGWDKRTYETQPHDVIHHPVTALTRSAIGREISRWMGEALKRPTEVIAQQFDAEIAEWEEMGEMLEMPTNDIVDAHQDAIDQVMRAAGIPSHIINSDTTP